MDILLIEDQQEQQSWFEKQLHSFGYNITVCSSADAVFKAVDQRFYPVVILDLASSGFDGRELCRELRALPQGAQQMVLVIPETQMSVNLATLAEIEADDFLQTPLHPEKIQLRLASLKRQWEHVISFKVKSAYLTSILRAMQSGRQLIGRQKDLHLALQQICEMLTANEGVLRAHIKVIDENGMLIKIAESPPQQDDEGTTESDSIATWIEHAGKCYGVMTVVLSQLLQSSQEEQNFLNDLAADIASALYSLELELKHRRTERALRESEIRYRELGDSITDLFFALDRDLRCVYWNKASEHLTGISAKQALGLSLYKLFPALPGTDAEQRYRDALQTQKPQMFIQTFQGKGKPQYFEVNVYPSREELSVLAKDVTYRKQMEDALKKSWDYLENLNNSLSDVIFTVNMPEQDISYVNRAVETMFGYSIDECIGKSTSMFFLYTEEYAVFSDTLQRAFAKQQQILRTEQVLKKKDGSHFTAEISTTFLQENHDLTGIISIVRDITHRKQMELALKRERTSLARKVEERTVELRSMNAELSRASRMKDEFLAKMSHELRTPLNAILGYAKILRKLDSLDQLHMEALETIQGSGEHLLQLINDILDLSKIEAGRLELHLSEFDFPEFLQQIAKMIQVRAAHKNIVFTYEHDEQLPFGVYADAKRLREVLINLLDNAIKFTEEGRVVFRVQSGEASRETISASQADRRPVSTVIHFEIEDTGTGIPQEQLAKIFLPFEQVGAHRYSSEGTGLGLSISHQLVALMGGELQVESVVDKGSTFWFDLELTEISDFSQKSHAQHPDIVGYTGEQRTVLIVDDKQENRSMLLNMLLPLGFEIFEASNGQECLDVAIQRKPDVILLDLLMPVMDGFESARHLRKTPDLQSVKIIAISASVFEETRQKSLEAGCDEFLFKPIEAEALLECLGVLLHLQWVYKDELDEPEPVAEESLVSGLPSEEIIFLRKWAESGNVTRILKQLDQLNRVDKQYHPLVGELRKFVKSFQLQKMIEYLDDLEKRYGE